MLTKSDPKRTVDKSITPHVNFGEVSIHEIGIVLGQAQGLRFGGGVCVCLSSDIVRSVTLSQSGGHIMHTTFSLAPPLPGFSYLPTALYYLWSEKDRPWNKGF